MKRILVALLAVVMVLGCTACSGGQTKDRLAQIKEKGYIEMVTEPYWVPNEFIDPSKTGDDKYIGVDIEFGKYIADKIGVELKIIPLEFTAVQAGIVDGKYDMAISAMAYSPTRAASMKMSDVYQPSSDGYGFLVRAEDVDKYTSIESLKDAVVVTQSGSVQESLFNDQIGKDNVKEFKLVSSMTDGYLAVTENKADVCITAISSANLYAEANGGLATPDFQLEVDPNMNGTVVAMPKEGSDSLCEIVNQCIAELTAENKFEIWEDEFKAYAKQLGIE
ncbi:MAG: transporter substrate-binding domain-containing protein [Candidatus Spyradocola sp.]